jgi:hypothetical protein
VASTFTGIFSIVGEDKGFGKKDLPIFTLLLQRPEDKKYAKMDAILWNRSGVISMDHCGGINIGLYSRCFQPLWLVFYVTIGSIVFLVLPSGPSIALPPPPPILTSTRGRCIAVEPASGAIERDHIFTEDILYKRLAGMSKTFWG